MLSSFRYTSFFEAWFVLGMDHPVGFQVAWLSFKFDTLWVHSALLLIIQCDFRRKSSICLHLHSENSFPVGFRLTRHSPNQNNVRFDLAASRNSSRTVSATILLRFRDFSKTEFLLVLSQPIGFQPNVPQIRTQHHRKPIGTRSLLENGIVQFHWLETEGSL